MTDYEIKMFNRGFGERVGKRRRFLELKGEKLAEMASITPQFLSEVERGKKSMRAAYVGALAQALDVKTDYLIFGTSSANDAQVQAVAEALLEYPPAVREMAAEQLQIMLNIIRASIPQ